MTDDGFQPPMPPTAAPPTASKRSIVLPLIFVAVVAAVAGLQAGRWLFPAQTDSVKSKVAAEEFCALGQGDGASLLQIGGWVTAAQRVNPNWDDVIAEIDDRCPEWRAQVRVKLGSLGN